MGRHPAHRDTTELSCCAKELIRGEEQFFWLQERAFGVVGQKAPAVLRVLSKPSGGRFNITMQGEKRVLRQVIEEGSGCFKKEW